MSPAARNVLDRLDGVRQKWWVFSLLSTGTWAVSLVIGSFFLIMALDAWLRFSQAPLALLLIGWLALTIFLGVLVCRRLMRTQRSLEATARCVEYEYPELGSDLINVVQLTSDTKNENHAFCDAAVATAARNVAGIRFEDAADHENRWRRFRFCMQTPRDFAESIGAFGLVLFLAVLFHVMMPNWSSAANRLMNPFQFTPSVGKVKIDVTPGDVDVLLGETVQVAAEINDIAPADEPFKATLFVQRGDAEEEAIPMTRGDRFEVASEKTGEPEPRRTYAISIPSITEDTVYRVEVGDSQSPRYTASVLQKPMVDEVEITYHYPAYLEQEPDTMMKKTAELEGPQYTRAVMRIRPTAPITRGRIDWEGGGATGRLLDDGRLEVEMVLLRNTTFTVSLFNGDNTSVDPRLNRVRVLVDAPPTIDLLKPRKNTTAAPGDELPIMVRATDDHALGRVELEVKVKPTPLSTVDAAEPRSETDAAADIFAEPEGFGGDGFEEDSFDAPTETSASVALPADDKTPIRQIHEWAEFENPVTSVVTHSLPLSSDLVAPGETLYVRAVAWDRRNFRGYGQELRAQKTVSPWKAVTIIDREKAVDEQVSELDNLRSSVFKILEKQIRAQARNVLIPRRASIDDAHSLAKDVRDLQVDVQKSSIALVKAIGDTDREDRVTIKKALNALAFGKMIEAVEQCDALSRAETLEAVAAPSESLQATQAVIIESLRSMLNIARRAQSEALAEMEHRSSGDLPPDAEQKMKDIQNALEEALEAQRKVIEASENLAKAPVEDFSDEEEQLVKALEAAEDAWDKFMKELNTDMSKLPEQDFANPSLLKELVEIQTEIKMAKDALTKKTADIAVPLEQLGAEMAEEIQTNMEKWLPDTPDRERWSQEESLTDEGKEAPMAELPGELEDLIGELMEEEEDLFDEMEDVSSSAADSPDKGAGWDVADGPISSMSAKGATGNRLPNSSEIGGRAGEGRQGKSSGEFVGDEAVGKGGRNTPTRLTQDANVAGQIKDHSKDPTGGATGGGKESGEGGEGLEGPTSPNRGDRDTNRLAGKQGALRNKAEGIDLKHFQVMGYHHTDLQKMIEVMGDVERDIEAGRYQNALRQRSVLAEGLGKVKQHLEGDFEVRRDATAVSPTDIQKEILGSMQDDSPIGWEQLNKKYFERLATGGGEDAP